MKLQNSNLIAFCLLFLVLYSCTFSNQKEIDKAYWEGYDNIEKGNLHQAIQHFERYIDLCQDEILNDSTLAVYKDLAELYHDTDSLEAAIDYTDIISSFYIESDTSEYINYQLNKAEYLVGGLYLDHCKNSIDSIVPYLQKVHNNSHWLRYYLLRDKLKYETLGYWDSKLLDTAFNYDNNVDSRSTYQLKIRQATHNIFYWEFKTADSLLSHLEDYALDWDNEELQTELKLCRVAYWDEQKDYIETESTLSDLLDHYDSTYNIRTQITVKTELARILLKRKRYKEAKLLIDELLIHHKNNGNINRELEIQYIRMDYFFSVGKYDHFLREIEYHIQNAKSMGLFNMAIGLTIIKSNTQKKQQNRKAAIETLDRLLSTEQIETFTRHYYNVHLRKVENLISSRLLNEGIELLNKMNSAVKLEEGNRSEYFRNLQHGRISYHKKDYQNSGIYFEKAMNLCSRIGFEHGYYTLLSNLSIVYAKQNKSDTYLLVANEALDYFNEVGNAKYISDINYNLGKYHYDKGNLQLSNKYLLKSVEYKERERLEASDNTRKEILDKEIGLYYNIQKNYFKLNDYENCYSIGEKARSKWMEEKLSFSDKEMGVPELESIQNKLKKDECFLVYSNNLYSKTLAILITSDSIFAQLSDNFQYMNDYLKIDHFLSYFQQNIDSLDFNKIKDRIESNKKVSHYQAIVIMKTFVSYYRYLLQIPIPSSNQIKYTEEIGALLYQFLIGNLSIHLDIMKEIIVVPDAYIGLIPFETLRNHESKYLIEKCDIKYVQSVTVWDYLQSRQYANNRSKILAFGDVDYEDNSDSTSRSGLFVMEIIQHKDYYYDLDSLTRLLYSYKYENIPGSEKELTYISSIFDDVELRKGKKASECNLKEMSQKGDLCDYEIIHFSTHGVFASGFPQLTSLVLSHDPNCPENGFLNLQEIAQLNLKADFVNLSACETGIGDIYSGDGMIGMAQAFTIAGANGMAVSMWQVPDESTGLFMKRVYEKIKREGKGYCEAINGVKLDYINGKYSELDTWPASWSMFIYFGR